MSYDELPGWTVERGGVSWIATRDEALSPQQLAYGCVYRVTAGSPSELMTRVTAENIVADMVRAAERLAYHMSQPDRQWREPRAEPEAAPEPAEPKTFERWVTANSGPDYQASDPPPTT